MGWKATGAPTIRKQRDKWVVRVDGIDTATGKHRPRQLATFASQRAALAAARSGQADRRSRSGLFLRDRPASPQRCRHRPAAWPGTPCCEG